MRAIPAHVALMGAVLAGGAFLAPPAAAHPAIGAFSVWRFKAVLTP